MSNTSQSVALTLLPNHLHSLALIFNRRGQQTLYLLWLCSIRLPFWSKSGISISCWTQIWAQVEIESRLRFEVVAFWHLRNCLSFLTFSSFIVGSSKWCAFISLENALCSWGNLNSIPAASMTPTDGSIGNIAAWPKKVSLLVFGLKPRREQPGVTWGLFHFLGVNFWLFFPSKLVDGVVMISSIILRWSALCQTAAYYMTQRRSSSSSQGSGCKPTICSGCSSALEWFCFHVFVSLETIWILIMIVIFVWFWFWFWLWLWFLFDFDFDYDCDVILPVCRSAQHDEAAADRTLMRNPGLHHDVSWGVPQDGIWEFLRLLWFLPCPQKNYWPLNKNPGNDRCMSWGTSARDAATCHPAHSVSTMWCGASQLQCWLP